MNSYELSRRWFDWCFENPEKISPNHTALFFFCIEHCNRLGWKEKFGLPSEMAKDAIGIKSYNTYIKVFRDLEEWGFIKVIQKSKNQYSANIIAISNFNKAHGKALDKAIIKHLTKHDESTCESICSIDKPLTNEPLTINKGTIEFELFWNLYDKKVGKKDAIEKKWNKLSKSIQQEILDYVPKYILSQPDKKYRKNPESFLNGKAWENELIGLKETNPTIIHPHPDSFPNDYEWWKYATKHNLPHEISQEDVIYYQNLSK